MDENFFDLPVGDDPSPTINDTAAVEDVNDIFGSMTMASAEVEEPVAQPAAQEVAAEEEEEESGEEEEITFLSIWQEKRAKHLAEKAEQEAAAKKALDEEAKSSVDSFYKNREEQIARNKEENRKQQAAFEETIYEENWQGVSQILGESLTKPKLGMAGHASETNRYRKLLIQLKNN